MKDYPFTNQNGKKRPQSKEWSDIRAEIIRVKTELNITDEFFRVLSPYDDYQGIEERTYQTFCKIENGKDRPVWLWKCLKNQSYCASLSALSKDYLFNLINSDETIWIGALDCVNEVSKIWFYEGKIEAALKILTETCFFDEFYFISKKYHWLICITHHDTLVVTGDGMPQKLKTITDSKI